MRRAIISVCITDFSVGLHLVEINININSSRVFVAERYRNYSLVNLANFKNKWIIMLVNLLFNYFMKICTKSKKTVKYFTCNACQIIDV